MAASAHDSGAPDRSTLLKALEIEWQDHFQTRRQTWKTLEIAAVLLVAFVIVDLRFDDTWLRFVLGGALLYSLVSGVIISIHHRRTQIRKFTHIDRLEEALGLHAEGLLDDVHPPRPFRWSDVIHPGRMNTPLFILRLHLAMLAFVVVYAVVRVGSGG